MAPDRIRPSDIDSCSIPVFRFVVLLLLTLLPLACQPVDNGAAVDLNEQDGLESAGLALSLCQTDEQCYPAPPCRVPHCVLGVCRYVTEDPLCCAADADCQPTDNCRVGHCAAASPGFEGICIFEINPLKPGCCSSPFDCPMPEPGLVATCVPDQASGYSKCGQEVDPEACLPPSTSIVINEFFANPNLVSEATGEWLELFNPGLEAVNLVGWTIRDEESDSFTIASAKPLLIQPGGYFLLGRSDNVQNNGGIKPDYVYYNFTLGNGIDEIILQNSSHQEVDRVEYYAPEFELLDGASMELINPYLDNNTPASWRVAQKTSPPFMENGTPGAPNTDAFFLYYTPVVCNDANSCTLDICGQDGLARCDHQWIRDCCLYHVDCDDGDPCTNDTCDASSLTCSHSYIPECCLDSSYCNDNNACTLDQCFNMSCRHINDPAKPECCVLDVDCKDINPCTVDYCSLDPGKSYKTCHHISPGGTKCCLLNIECNDNKPETIDTCTNYHCIYGPNPAFCLAPPPAYCNDGDPCTLDSCNFETSLCEHEVIPGCCKTNSECNDSDPCTQDVCQLAIHECAHAPTEGCCHTDLDCLPFVSDADTCREPTCVNNTCRMVHVPNVNCCLTAADCVDEDACTTDSCDPTTRKCLHKPVAGNCCNTADDCDDDDDPCTRKECVANQCFQQHLSGCCKADFECDDGDICTVDVCEDFKCRFAVDHDIGCCEFDADCPVSESPCIWYTCSPGHECVVAPIEPCVVGLNYYERFQASSNLADMGWTTTESPVGQFVWTGPGAPLGPDGSVSLQANAQVAGGTVCVESPYFSAPSAVETVTATFEQVFSINLTQTAGQHRFYVEARSLGEVQKVPLVDFKATSASHLGPYQAGIPSKLLSAPFQLRFCAEVPQGASDIIWNIDTVMVGRGIPPRLQPELTDLQLTPGQTAIQTLEAFDPDSPILQFHLVGPTHVTSKGVVDLAPGHASTSIQFAPRVSQDLGLHQVSLEVSDGFFYDKTTMNELAYIPKCYFDSDCNDFNECSVDNCNPVVGCSYEFIKDCCNSKTLCDDSNWCTTDICANGKCEYASIDCSDGNICTLDECDPATGCTHPFALVPCDDGNACTWHDLCSGGQCVGAPVDCNDGLTCTLDSCAVASGCQHKSLCSDSIACTTDVCTQKGCKSGKLPIGTPVLDGNVGNDWLESSSVQAQGPLVQDFRMETDQDYLYVSFRANVTQGHGLALFLDGDFTKGTGLSNLSQTSVGTTGLQSVLAPATTVTFPGFGAELAVVARWTAGAPPAAPETGCYGVSTQLAPVTKACQILVGSNGSVEARIPWQTLLGNTVMTARLAAAVLVRTSPAGQVLESVPATVNNEVADAVFFGITDATCLLPTCGDGVTDTGEECDAGLNNSNVIVDRCRLNCKKPYCGDAVVDTGEQCDMGVSNSDVLPDKCRTDCKSASCGDNVIDSGETCDNGALNSDEMPDACRNSCQEAFCGDSVVDSDEGCDQGDLNSDTLPDRCRTNCLSASCGDGIQDTTEECDTGIYNSDILPNHCRVNCREAWCGDNVVDFGEECDRGTGNSNTDIDGCRLTCKAAYCGDGVTDSDEGCDDGNNVSWDGCQADCTLYITTCGDGIQTPDEQCDDGGANSNVLPNACRTDCKNAHCGDGVIDDGEICDDGNLLGGDACDVDCTPYVAGCGSGWVDPGEECDDGPLNSDVMPDACRTDCQAPECGDLVVDSGEFCDNGPLNSNTQPDACRLECVLAHCGDGIVDNKEECDEAGNNSPLPNRCKPDCKQPFCGDGLTDTSYGEQCDAGPANSDTVPNSCRKNCLPARCGDGVLDAGEVCDNGTLNSNTIANRCRLDCQPWRCGDGVIDTNEACDDGPLNSDTQPDACRTDCSVPICGDSVPDYAHGEDCDWGPGNSDMFPDACRSDCSSAGCGDSVIDSGEYCDDGNTAAHDGCTAQCQKEVYLPEPGDIIITEVMQNPAIVSDSVGEWFEIYNTRDYQIDIVGWLIADNGIDSHIIGGSEHIWIAPHSYFVLGLSSDTSTNGNAHVDYVYPSSAFLLGNGSDSIIISFNGYISDQVSYDGGPVFPDPSGASMNLDPDRFSRLANDDGGSWCESTTKLHPGGDMGTPGQPNIQCLGVN